MDSISELMEELSTASSLLKIALGRYLNSCSAIQTYYTRTTSACIPRAVSNRISSELTSASSYNTQLSHARSLISQVRNSSVTLAPIQSLPSELLVRIFQLVVGASCDVNVHSLMPTSLPKYPDFLSHVCSRWRNIVINLPALWSHIDLIEWHPLGPKFVDRASVCVSRAGDLPLSVYIRVPASHDVDVHVGGGRLVHSIAHRTTSVELVIPNSRQEFEPALYEYFFDTFEPNTLLHLTIIDHGTYTPDFVTPSDSYDSDFDGSQPPGYLLTVAEEDFEDLLSSVQTLRLEGLYPLWSSLAYHGLVELYLHRTGTGTGIAIHDWELHDILTASPKLTTLHFGLHIIADRPSYLSAPPVRLGDLKRLNLVELSDSNDLPNFLKLLAPTPNSLRLSFWLHPGMSLSPGAKSILVTFLRQSNVMKLHLKGSEQKLNVRNLLGLFTQLRVLILESFDDKESLKQPTNIGERDLQKCRLSLDHFHQLGQVVSIQTIVLQNSYVYRDGRVMQDEQAREELSIVCPIVKNLGFQDPGATFTKDWDFEVD